MDDFIIILRHLCWLSVHHGRSCFLLNTWPEQYVQLPQIHRHTKDCLVGKLISSHLSDDPWIHIRKLRSNDVHHLIGLKSYVDFHETIKTSILVELRQSKKQGVIKPCFFSLRNRNHGFYLRRRF